MGQNKTMEREPGIDPKAVRAVIIDGACLWGTRQVSTILGRLRQDRHVVILNRMDLSQPASDNTPVAALFLTCRRLGIAPSECLLLDHDHRRVHLAALLGFQPAVLLSHGGHTRKLLTAGLLALKDLESMGIVPLAALAELVPLLQLPRGAID